jgi:hypothetical protein
MVSKLKLTSAPVHLTAVTLSGIDENSDLKLTIYPNPISSDKALTITGLKTVWSTVIITDMLGKVVYREALNQHENIQTKEIDISPLKRGMYIIQFEKKEESIANKFVVI